MFLGGRPAWFIFPSEWPNSACFLTYVKVCPGELCYYPIQNLILLMMIKQVSRIVLVCVCVASAALLNSCGGKPEDKSSTVEAKAEPAPPAKPVGPLKKVEITANDKMKFSVYEIIVAPSQPVEITLTNVGTMPKFSMGHNLVILYLGADTDAFVIEASNHPTNDYIPPASDSIILAYTKLLGPNESDTITFTAPSIKGDYPFICSFPGHYQVGMKGVLKVQ